MSLSGFFMRSKFWHLFDFEDKIIVVKLVSQVNQV